MKAIEFIDIFDGFTSQEYSDLPMTQEKTERVEQIIDHYRTCPVCAESFDDMEYEGTWLYLAAKMQEEDLFDWICKNKGGHSPSNPSAGIGSPPR